MQSDKHVHVCEECWKKAIKADGRCANHQCCGRNTYCAKNVKVSKSLNILEKDYVVPERTIKNIWM